MAFNGSGTFVRLHSWTDDRNNGIKITADRHDEEDDGFASALSAVICKDGQSTATARIPFAEGISVAGGTVSAPGISIVGDANSGFYQIGADNIGIALGGAKAADFSTSRTGIVGDLTLLTSGKKLKLADGGQFYDDTGTARTIIISNGDRLDVLNEAGTNTIIKLDATNGSALTGNLTISGTLGVTGAVTLSSTLAVTSAITASGGMNAAANISTTGNITCVGLTATGTMDLGDSSGDAITINGTVAINSGGTGAARIIWSAAAIEPCRWNRTGGSGTMCFIQNAGITVGSISQNGSNTAYNTSSDIRLKNWEGSISAEDSGAIIDALNPGWFRWKYVDGNPFGFGFKAHEFLEIIPWGGSPGDGDPDKTPSDEGFEPAGADLSAPMPVVIAELKYLRARVAALEAA